MRSVSTFKSQNQPCSSTRWSLKRQKLMRETASNTKTIKLLMEERAARLLRITPCYLLMPLLKGGPLVGIHAISVANLMSEATAPCMGNSDKCKGPNHFKAVCHSKVTAATTAPSPYRKKQSQLPTRRTSMDSNSGNGKGGGRQFSKKKMPKKPPKQKTYEVTFKNSKMVPSRVTPGGGNGKVLQNLVLSGKVPEEEGTYNRFSCCAVNSKMAQSTNTKSKPSEGLYTDTDPDNRYEIITHITIRVPGKAGTMMMEVKVDPGGQPSCIPLHKFKILLHHLCRDGLPKEGLLDNTHNEFESYDGRDLTCYGHFLIDAKDCHQEVSSH